MKSIDLNADLGEGYGNDIELMKYVSSANIACGLHAGSPHIMRETVKQAIINKVSIGAHPGYPDREGFGRTKMDIPYEQLYSIILYQLGALKAIVESEGAKLSHVKAHGALYNSSAKNSEIANAIVMATKALDPKLIIYGQAGSKIEEEAKKKDMSFCSEVFADRAYMDDGSLVPRTENGAIIEDKLHCSERVLIMIRDRFVLSKNGNKVDISADTVCLHGDNEKAIEFANHLYNALKNNNISIRPYNK